MSLDGYSEADLMHGCDAADEWKKSKADFTLGAFKTLCAKRSAHPSHLIFHALPHKKSSPETIAKFREQRKRESGI